ncbi:hypothetical protein VTN31DRAFT_1556 [Thermomyces dupontii]|uniref:uncharacterized protein n=1 Tax=Talaromyces thermophilus TaxID=28565 RepID=UPI0037429F13
MSAIPLQAAVTPAPAMLSPWTLLDKVWTTIFDYSAENFRYRVGSTPMSTLSETLVTIAFYYATIFGGWYLMRDRKPYSLNGLFMAHNLILTAVSGGLLLLFLEQLIPSLWEHGLYKCICSSPGWADKLVLLYYLNYLTKYVELLDTVFLVLKKKPLTFLHTYHHGATVFLCYTQLRGKTPVSWVPITLNLTVHVVMYWYYFQSARGVRIWWKEWITRLQIIQFILDLGFIYFATWDYYADEFGFDNLHIGKCEGDLPAAITGCVTLSSYLVLFISFYISTYRKPSSKSRKANGVKSGSKDQVVSASGRAAETLKSARSRFGHASLDMVEASTKGQWPATRE